MTRCGCAESKTRYRVRAIPDKDAAIRPTCRHAQGQRPSRRDRGTTDVNPTGADRPTDEAPPPQFEVPLSTRFPFASHEAQWPLVMIPVEVTSVVVDPVVVADVGAPPAPPPRRFGISKS
jgi:hypothetical protein